MTPAYHDGVRDLGLGWSTDLAVSELFGSTVEDRDDHLVIRTPANPTYHWGNSILVTDSDATNEADRWAHIFGATFPSATWVAIGLPTMPGDARAWAAHRLALDVDEVFMASTLPHQTPAPDDYTVRPLEGDDWEQNLALAVAENERTDGLAKDAYTPFARARNEAKRAISDARIGTYYGAFADGSLAASLGIIRCGETARYQDILTDADHRRRGVASHLLGVAARWAESYGCDRWVVVTEATNPARRVYQRAGLELHSTKVQAYRGLAI